MASTVPILTRVVKQGAIDECTFTGATKKTRTAAKHSQTRLIRPQAGNVFSGQTGGETRKGVGKGKGGRYLYRKTCVSTHLIHHERATGGDAGYWTVLAGDASSQSQRLTHTANRGP